MGRLGWGHGRYFFALFGVIILKGGCVGRIKKIIGGVFQCSSWGVWRKDKEGVWGRIKCFVRQMGRWGRIFNIH